MSTHDGGRMLAGARIDRRSKRLLGLYAGLGAALCVVFMASLCIGPVWIGPSTVLSLLHGDGADPLAIIAREIRLPRALLAILVGGSLGLGGAALQGLLRNPLAEPGIIGVSGCAALGAVLALYTGLAAVAYWMLPAFAILGAFVSVFVLYALAGRSAPLLTLILAGIAINALAGALTTLTLNLAPNPFAAYEVFFLADGLAVQSQSRSGPDRGTFRRCRMGDAAHHRSRARSIVLGRGCGGQPRCRSCARPLPDHRRHRTGGRKLRRGQRNRWLRRPHSAPSAASAGRASTRGAARFEHLGGGNLDLGRRHRYACAHRRR